MVKCNWVSLKCCGKLIALIPQAWQKELDIGPERADSIGVSLGKLVFSMADSECFAC